MATSLEVPRLKSIYNDEIRAKLQTDLGLPNVMQVPRLEKIVINVGCGGATEHKQLIDKVVDELTIISGQKPVVTKAKKSIAGFKLREGNPIGCLLYTSPSPRDGLLSRMPSSA